MGNLLIGLKRFLKNKNTVTIVAILASIGILYWAYDYRIGKDIEPVSVPVATKVIGPRVAITSDMITTKKVPKKIARKNVIINRNAIVGKYVKNNVVIPEGSMFYNDTVVDLDKLPTSLFEDIPSGNTVIYLSVDMNSTYGNSIFPGNAIDIYFRDGKYLGRFIKSIKVLAVVDGQGNSVFETAGNPGSPVALMFSIPDDLFVLLKKAQEKGYELFPVPRNAEYTEQSGETKIASQEIRDYIERKTLSDDVIYKNSKGGN